MSSEGAESHFSLRKTTVADRVAAFAKALILAVLGMADIAVFSSGSMAYSGFELCMGCKG